MSKITGNEPVFPILELVNIEIGMWVTTPGITLRQQLASRQMAAIRGGLVAADIVCDSEFVATQALADADALIAALNK